MNKKTLNTEFYQNLGKLFYAMAATDKTVHSDEFKRLQELVKSHWLAVDQSIDMHQEDTAYQLEVVFDWLATESEISSEEAYQEFLNYSFEHAYFFNEPVKQLIVKTAGAIAGAFAGTNKSELILLARIESDLRKLNATGYSTQITKT